MGSDTWYASDYYRRRERDAAITRIGSGSRLDSNAGAAELAARPVEELLADPRLPDDTRLWTALQAASRGGTWGGCVYDLDAILQKLQG